MATRRKRYPMLLLGIQLAAYVSMVLLLFVILFYVLSLIEAYSHRMLAYTLSLAVTLSLAGTGFYLFVRFSKRPNPETPRLLLRALFFVALAGGVFIGMHVPFVVLFAAFTIPSLITVVAIGVYFIAWYPVVGTILRRSRRSFRYYGGQAPELGSVWLNPSSVFYK